ncbi:MAG TPA: glycosyltransferase family 2 protein [Paracoccus sp.]|nr:glycosyltransferase family 2 protein [Paracoccus sp. (in: a-proteobacteria)]
MTAPPALSCILTAGPSDAAGVAHTLAALMALEGDLEFMVIDHGARPETRALLEKERDPRLRVLRMAPAPRGAARNRGLAHTRGERVCVLAPGDTLAPFALRCITEIAVDVLFLPATIRQADGTLVPVAQPVLEALANAELEGADATDPRFAILLRHLALLPGHSALRVVNRSLVRDHALAFAHEADSGWLYAIAALMNADDLAVAGLPCVTLNGSGNRDGDSFATLSDCAQAIHLFERAQHFHDPELRMALIGAVLAGLHTIADTLPDDERSAFDNGCALMLARSDSRSRGAFSAPMRAMFEGHLATLMPALGPALDFARSAYALSEPARQRRQSAMARLVAWGRGQSGGGSAGG